MADQIREALARAKAFLAAAGVENPSLDAEVLLRHLLGMDRAELYLHFSRPLAKEQLAGYQNLIVRRGRGEPVAYLIGHKEFMGLDLDVGPGVLVPRPETELLVEKALVFLKEMRRRLSIVVDVGTGSGAIAVSLASLNARVEVYAVDCSARALLLARRNADRHGVADRVHYRQGDLLTPLSDLNLAGRVDLVVANLPYIPATDIPGLPVDVRLYEPHLALDGGVGGLDIYYRLLPGAKDLLRPGGYLLLEIGPGQGELLGRELAGKGWFGIEVLPDYADRERIIMAQK